MSDPFVEYQVGATPEDTFAVPFQFWEKGDLYVEVGGIEETNFNVTGTGEPTGGSMILVTAVTNTTVSIRRFTIVLRITDFPIAGPFRIEALNSEFDHVYAVLQDLEFGGENVTIPWDNVTGKPSTYPPSAHTHPLAEVPSTLSGTFWRVNDDWTPVPTEFNPSAHTHVEADITDLNRLKWRGNWVDGNTYLFNDVALDYPYLAVANKTTTDRPAPIDQGAPFFVYQGASPTSAITAKTLLVGNTYTLPVALRILSARVYTITGNFYSVFLKDVATGVVDEIATFTADQTGWRTIAAQGTPKPAGTTFEIGVFVQEPDPTPTTFTLSYNYTLPNNTGVPGVGTIIHSNRESSEFRVNKTDQVGDQSAQLATMDVGDTIDGAGVRWAIQSITDNGTWINFGVAPATQGAPAGVQDFIFETVTATPITTVIDPDYYLSNADVSPFFEVDGGGRQSSDDGYGVDVEVQQIDVSDDWDLMAQSGASGGGGDGGGGASTFTQLSDTPETFAGSAGLSPVVNDDEDALVFETLGVGIGSTLPLSAAHGNQFFLTVEPVGMYVYIDENVLGTGTSSQWVMQNGGQAALDAGDIVDEGANYTIIGNKLIQWGDYSAFTSTTVVFPVPFDNEPRVAVNGDNASVSNGPRVGMANNISTTQMTVTGIGSNGATNVAGTWIAIGDAPADRVMPTTFLGTGITEFHDPTGAASWRLIGTTLECWGTTPGSSATESVVFPRTFASAPTVVTNNESSANNTVGVVVQGTITTTGVDLISFVTGNTSTFAKIKHWHAIGQVGP